MCIFCNFSKSNISIINENDLAISFYDKFPVTLYHSLIIPKRHVSSFFELTKDELSAINDLLFQQQEYLLSIDSSISGFNIGNNVGISSGQTIMHVHTHLIPRRDGDMSDPTGGVRGVIPEKQKY